MLIYRRRKDAKKKNQKINQKPNKLLPYELNQAKNHKKNQQCHRKKKKTGENSLNICHLPATKKNKWQPRANI